MKSNAFNSFTTDSLSKDQKHFGRTAKSEKPTEQLMSEGFQIAYDFFNETLFGDLPQCMMTLDVHRKSTLGYFMPYSYVSQSGELKHQIAMNPEYLRTRTLEQSLSTLVHEQCHLWVFDVLGRETSNGYHCKQWARKMESVGLIPSNTGKPGGQRTGYRMTHYIEVGGRFAKACATLIDSGFGFEWAKASREMQAMALDLKIKPLKKPKESDQTKGKVKWICPVCNKACWGAPGLELSCIPHSARLVRAERIEVLS